MKRITCFLSSIAISLSVVNAKPLTTNQQTELIASVLVAEAGGEGIKGMQAVFEVIQTRSKERKVSRFQVVTQKYQFSCYNAYWKNPIGFINKWKSHSRYQSALLIVKSYKGNLTKGSNHYVVKTINPEWSRGIKPLVVIGNHKFFLIDS